MCEASFGGKRVLDPAISNLSYTGTRLALESTLLAPALTVKWVPAVRCDGPELSFAGSFEPGRRYEIVVAVVTESARARSYYSS